MEQKVWLVASQKGGAGKTTIATALARHLALESAKSSVLLCDTDIIQWATIGWYELRGKVPLPRVTVKKCPKTTDVGRWASSAPFDHVVIDGAPHASKQTMDLALASDVVILPTWTTAMSMAPTLRLAGELVDGGVDKERIIIPIMCAGSEAEVASAIETMSPAGFRISPVANYFSTAYGKVSDKGLAITEIEIASLRKKASAFIDELTK